MNLVHGIALLALVSSGFLYARRIKLGEVARNISIWVGVAAVLVLGYSFRDDFSAIGQRLKAELLPAQGTVRPGGVIELIRTNNGHFEATMLANGHKIRFLVDTGATGIVLSPADAERIGIDQTKLTYDQAFSTANGRGWGARYRLKTLSLGPILFQDVGVSVNQAAMSNSLLGMSFLNRLSSFEIEGAKMTMRYQN